MGITWWKDRKTTRKNRVEAAKREVKDEAGLKLKSLVDVVRVEVGEFIEDKPDVNCFILYSDSFSGQSKYFSDEHQEINWVTAEEFKDTWNGTEMQDMQFPAMEYLEEYIE